MDSKEVEVEGAQIFHLVPLGWVKLSNILGVNWRRSPNREGEAPENMRSKPKSKAKSKIERGGIWGGIWGGAQWASPQKVFENSHLNFKSWKSWNRAIWCIVQDFMRKSFFSQWRIEEFAEYGHGYQPNSATYICVFNSVVKLPSGVWCEAPAYQQVWYILKECIFSA